jgi:hypothetical protein
VGSRRAYACLGIRFARIPASPTPNRSLRRRAYTESLTCIRSPAAPGRRLQLPLALVLSGALAPASQAGGGDDFTHDVAPLLARYCTGCHDREDPAGDLDLEHFVSSRAARAEPELLRRVRDALREDEMPPATADSRPSEAERAKILDWITRNLTESEEPHIQESGRTTLRRLNRLEYRMAVLDLLGIDYPTEEHLPADGVSHGFDVIGETLSMPPILFERYLDAAEQIAHQAVPIDDAEEIPLQHLSIRDLHPAEHHEYVERTARFAMYANGKSTINTWANKTGEYILRVEASARQAGPHPARLVLSANSKRIERLDIEAHYPEPAVYEVRTQLEAGEVELGLAYINDYHNPEQVEPEGRDRNLYLSSVELVGPLDERETTHFLRRYPLSEGESEEDARRALERLAPLCWRGPVTDAELDELLALSEPDSGERERLRAALVALLVSPRFLFRFEPQPVEGGRLLLGRELATRLAAFLWSSVPDEELLALAANGDLLEQERLQAQVQRMLRDARSSRLARGFARGWLQLDRLELASPDPDRFPRFDSDLRSAMRRESELFFEAMLREGRPISEFLGSDFTFVDENLAKHYGLPGVEGSAMQRVPIPEDLRGRRGGLLGQAALLTTTSHAVRTSPVLRGKWVLEALLARPPAPPPPGTAILDERRSVLASASIRERLTQHRSDPVCAACHAPMDGLGFALEHYGPTGAWRDYDGNFPVDARGDFPGEAPIHGAQGLRERLLEDGNFLHGLSHHLFTYALGRALSPDDETQLDTVLQGLSADPTLNDLLHALCGSAAFRTRQGEAPRPPMTLTDQ